MAAAAAAFGLFQSPSVVVVVVVVVGLVKFSTSHTLPRLSFQPSCGRSEGGVSELSHAATLCRVLRSVPVQPIIYTAMQKTPHEFSWYFSQVPGHCHSPTNQVGGWVTKSHCCSPYIIQYFSQREVMTFSHALQSIQSILCVRVKCHAMMPCQSFLASPPHLSAQVWQLIFLKL